jgi:hypothetical protein
MNVTRTIPRDEKESHIKVWFQGEKREQRFPVKGKPQRLFSGDYLFIIWKGSIYGRFRVLDIERIPDGKSSIVGSRKSVTKGTHNIIVEAPGEFTNIITKRRGHMGIRYDEVVEWNTSK